jgi:hypothetical protein
MTNDNQDNTEFTDPTAFWTPEMVEKFNSAPFKYLMPDYAGDPPPKIKPEYSVQELKQRIAAMSVPLNAAHRFCIYASLHSFTHLCENPHPWILELEKAMRDYIESPGTDRTGR